VTASFFDSRELRWQLKQHFRCSPDVSFPSGQQRHVVHPILPTLPQQQRLLDLPALGELRSVFSPFRQTRYGWCARLSLP